MEFNVGTGRVSRLFKVMLGSLLMTGFVLGIIALPLLILPVIVPDTLKNILLLPGSLITWGSALGGILYFWGEDKEQLRWPTRAEIRESH